jgi:hypothetical protein
VPVNPPASTAATEAVIRGHCGREAPGILKTQFQGSRGQGTLRHRCAAIGQRRPLSAAAPPAARNQQIVAATRNRLLGRMCGQPGPDKAAASDPGQPTPPTPP